MRQIVFWCLLSLFALTTFAQVVDPLNSVIIYPSSLNAQNPGFISIIQRTSTGAVVQLQPSTCNTKVPYSLNIINGPGYNVTLNPKGFTCVFNNNVSYTISFYITKSGNYVLDTLYNGSPVSNSTTDLTVVPGSFSAAESTWDGIGLTNALAGEPSPIAITAYDQFSNRIFNCSSVDTSYFEIQLYQASIENSINGVYQNCSNGVFNFYYVVNITGNWFLSASYGGLNINNSFVLVTPGNPIGPNCAVSDPSANITAGELSTFSIVCTDQFGNLVTYCQAEFLNLWFPLISSPNATVSANLTSCDAETGNISWIYNLTVASFYTSNVYFGDPTNSIPQFSQLVNHGPPDEANTQAIGNGVNDTTLNVAGTDFYFALTSADRFGNPIGGCINSTNWFFNFTDRQPTTPPSENPSCYQETILINDYSSTQTGRYPLTILLNGQVINNGVSYNPKVYSAGIVPESVNVTGEGTTNATAGLSAPLYINGLDQFSNQFDNCEQFSDFSQWSIVLTETSNSSNTVNGLVLNCQILDGLSTYIAAYTPYYAGEYSLNIYINQTIVPETYNVTVIPGPLVVMHAQAQGLGFTPTNANVTAGETETFEIVQYDQYDNQIMQCTSNLIWTATFFSTSYNVSYNFTSDESDCDNTTGIYTVTYTIKYPTDYYQIIVSTDYSGPVSIIIPDAIQNKGSIYLLPTNFSAGNSYFAVDQIGSVGQAFNITVFAYDLYNNEYDLGQVLELNFTANLRFQPNNGTHYGYFVYGNYGNQYLAAFVPTIEGNYTVRVDYTRQEQRNVTIRIRSENNTNVAEAFYGNFDPINSYFYGPALTGPTVAGQIGYFMLAVYNEYNFQIPAFTLNADDFTPTLVGNQSTVYTITTNFTAQYYDVVFAFNATIATTYSVSVFYDTGNGVNDQLANDTTVAQVIPGPLVPPTLDVVVGYGPVNAQGNFSVTGQDQWGNYVNLSSLVSAEMNPICAGVEPNCSAGSFPTYGLDCTYDAPYSGTYCIDVQDLKTGAVYSGGNANVSVVGGSACKNNCNSRGYCFNATDDEPSCNCFQGYTGSDCSDKISHDYMNLWLAIGLIVGLSLLLAIIGIAVGCLVGRRS